MSLHVICIVFVRSPESGSWRGVRISNGVLFPPTEEGWDHYKYVVVSRPQPVSGGVSDEAIVKKERREERVDYREREPIEMGEAAVKGSWLHYVCLQPPAQPLNNVHATFNYDF